MRDTLPEYPSVGDDESTPTGLSAFRSKVERFALPTVMALAVAAGLVFGGISPDGGQDQNLSAVPAAAVADRNADGTSRSGERTPEETAPVDQSTVAATEATETPGATETPAADPDAPAQGLVAEPKALNRITTTAPSAAASASRMFATETVNVRAQANASSERIGSVDKGDSVNATGEKSNGFTQISLEGRTGWVTSEFLSRTAPTAAASRAGGSSSSSSAAAAAPAPAYNGPCNVARGVTPRAAALNRALCAQFPFVTSYGGLRPGDSGAHGSGRALDVMISGSRGDTIANWARANAGRYGITEVIWSQRIWTTQRAGEGWRGMSDRGSATANHYDHVHITVA